MPRSTAVRLASLTAVSIALLLPATGFAQNNKRPKRVDRYRTMAVYLQWQNLMGNGCQVESYNISTPLEARVLRNTAYAIAGKKFKSAELTELFRADGNWYTPTGDNPKLSKTTAKCIAKVSRWEKKLRKRIKINKKVEAFLTRDRKLYLDLRELQYAKDLFSGEGGTVKNNEASWYFSHGKKCFYDGDCGGYVIDCKLEGGKVSCELVAAG